MSDDHVQIIETPLYLGTHWSDRRLPSVLTIAGSDNSGGAGIEADVKTITAHGCYAMTCITAVTCQVPSKVYSSVTLEESHVTHVLEVTLGEMACDCIKIGMLTFDALRALVSVLDKVTCPIILDPVMVATSGSELSPVHLWETAEMKRLLNRVTLITPNIPEAHALVGETGLTISSVDDLIALARKVAKICGCNVLLKGGHCPLQGIVVDVLLYEQQVYAYRSNELKTHNLHGTGCTLSSSIASSLAFGSFSVAEAVGKGIQYVHNAILSGKCLNLTMGKVNGPLNHVYSISRGVPYASEMKINFDTMLQLPEVKESWENYINHDFVKMVSDGTMNMKRFEKYLKQDYNYLQVFARIHAKLAGESTDNEGLFLSEAKVLQNILHEMAKQESMLGSGIKTHDKSAEMLNYTNYLKEVAQYGNWEQLYTATMPCCLGYVFAVRKVSKESTITKDSHPLLHQWMQEYLREDFYQAALHGIQTLDTILKQSTDVRSLVKIFRDVCDLECKFWDQGG